MMDLVAFLSVVVVAHLSQRWFSDVKWLSKVVRLVLIVVVACAGMAVSEMADGPVWLRLVVAVVVAGLLWLVVVPVRKGGRKWVFLRGFAVMSLFVLPLWWGIQMAMVRSAVLSGDDQSMESRVDFPALNQSLVSQLDDHFLRVDTARSATPPDTVVEWLAGNARGARRWLVKKVVKSMLTPEGLHELATGPADSEVPAVDCEWNGWLRVVGFAEWRLRVDGGWLVFSADNPWTPARMTDIQLSQRTLDRVESR